LDPDLVLDTSILSVQQSVNELLKLILPRVMVDK